MANAFSRTQRSLANDTSGRSLTIWALVLVLLAAWLGWSLFTHVTVYEVSTSARLEVEHAAHAAAALLPGRILSTSVQLGKRVRAGEVLAELDARSERLRLAEEQTRLRAIPPQLEALQRQLADQENAGARAGTAASSAVAEARARYQEALAAANFADESASRLAQLSTTGRIAEIDAMRARTEAAKARAAAEALAFEVNRLSATGLGGAAEKRAGLQSLKRELAALIGAQELATATIARLQQDIEKHLIRAPVAGIIGEATPLEAGAFVDEGGLIASIVPAGDMKVVAEFAPARVLGRVTPGQTARMRLDAFPWAQFGTLALQVERVASEVRNGRIRVELTPHGTNDARLLQHGLPGSVEVAVERTTPAMLALRAAGQIVTRPAQARSASAVPARALPAPEGSP
jgi:membrane fusion protein, adhesin transport system